MIYSILTVAALTASASAGVFRGLDGVPKGWEEVRPAEASEPIALRVALHQQNAEAFEQAVVDMSTPGHEKYGKHMTGEQVRSMVAPSQESTDTVVNWLSVPGVKVDTNGDWINVRTTVGEANQLLNTTFAWYHNEVGNTTVLRTLHYTIPDAMVGYVDLVQPTTRFGEMRASRSTIFSAVPQGPATGRMHPSVADSTLASCGGGVTPACLKSLYSINYTAPAAGNSIGFSSYLKEYSRYRDLSSFISQYVPSAKGQNFSVTEINGGLNDQNAGDDSGEANLDVQYILGVSHPIPITEYSTGGLGPWVATPDQPTAPGSDEPYLDFLNYILNQTDAALPQTLSTSYGEGEDSVPQDYALKICNMFMQLGARGVSVLFSSGDSGPGDSCETADGKTPYFNPTFPAGCPYVTAVGATTGTNPEQAVGFSSGGFSTLHARPAWQDAAVSAYLAKPGAGQQYAGKYFNASGRGIPDVAAQGSGFHVVDKGGNTLLDGTSASCPTFAGVVALLNAARKSKGMAPMGFLNPWLYNNTAALTDITEGSSSGCANSRAFPSGAGFPAVAGWDPVTGLGTPKFDKLLQAAAPGVANA